MKIAAFFSDNPFAGWIQTHGFAEVLERMGHEVVSIAVPARVSSITQAQADRINKPIDDCELILVSGPEWLSKWIETFYPEWAGLKVPKVGWYHESFVRDDFTLDYKRFERNFDFHFFPDKDDAEKYKGTWLPLGVDTELFAPQPVFERDIPVAFVGLMYPKRAQFYEQVKPHLGNLEIALRYAQRAESGSTWLHPAIGVYDFDGLNIRKSMELLAETYRRIRVFVTFPSMSRVLVAKVLESISCGCTLVCPKQPVELPCYEYESPYECAEQIKKALDHSLEASEFVQANHRMELRFEEIFRKVGMCASSSPAPVGLSATI